MEIDKTQANKKQLSFNTATTFRKKMLNKEKTQPITQMCCIKRKQQQKYMYVYKSL